MSRATFAVDTWARIRGLAATQRRMNARSVASSAPTSTVLSGASVHAAPPSAPLQRASAKYRECRNEPGHECTLAEACCNADDECTSGLTCQRAQNEQFVPANFYWVGPYAPGGSGFGGGMIDYFAMLNARDGGINGVKLTWEKCETEYNNARGVECYERSKKKGPTGATVIHPLSTGITYSLIEKATQDRIPIISMGYGRTSGSDRWVGKAIIGYAFPVPGKKEGDVKMPVKAMRAPAAFSSASLYGATLPPGR